MNHDGFAVIRLALNQSGAVVEGFESAEGDDVGDLGSVQLVQAKHGACAARVRRHPRGAADERCCGKTRESFFVVT